MLSSTCKSAVKAVIFLATQQESGKRMGIKEIAGHIEANEHTVGKMLQILVRQEVINSLKGPSGGFFMTEQQIRQPIMSIVEAIDGKQYFTTCGLGVGQCSSRRPCPLHDEYRKAREIIEKTFQTKKVEDLSKPVHNGLAYLFG